MPLGSFSNQIPVYMPLTTHNFVCQPCCYCQSSEIVKYDARMASIGITCIPNFVKNRQVGSKDETGGQTVQTHNCTNSMVTPTVFPYNKGKMAKRLHSQNMKPTIRCENNEFMTNRMWSFHGIDFLSIWSQF